MSNGRVAAPKPFTDGSGDAVLPVGAHATKGGVAYRVWAPDHAAASALVHHAGGAQTRIDLEHEGEGYYSGLDLEGRAGDRYWFQVGDLRLPDPASRYQPAGVEGPSEVVDPRSHLWVAANWRPPAFRGRVIYELHVGTFTSGGTFRAAISRLDDLAGLGVNTVELMPVADFPGARNWGYDGVMLFAPARCYGTPGDLRSLVDAAHERGLAVILDVVYNHFGPVGNVLPRYSSFYLHRARHSAWGQAVNFDGPNSTPVRAFVLQNVCHWLDEYRFDGLRLDALHAIEDESPTHIVAEIAAAVHVRGGFVVGEDERNEAWMVSSRTEGGWGLDAVWADDFHHITRVALTQERHAYLANYDGTIEEWLAAFREGWLFCGQMYRTWRRHRGTPAAHVPPERFVWCISNHDQVGNRPMGDRLGGSIAPEAYRAVSMLLCLTPYTPLLFMGQEWSASSSFPYFTDLPAEIGDKVREGRLDEFRRRDSPRGDAGLVEMPDPQAESTFLGAKLRWNERDTASHAGVLSLYRECLRIRAENPVFQSPPRESWSAERAGAGALALRWRWHDRHWLLLCSLSTTRERSAPASWARPRSGRSWQPVLDSNEARFGGPGGRETNAGEDGAPVPAGPGAVLLRET